MNKLLFLDFDGVIGDSIPECFVVSWIAYYHLLHNRKPVSVELKDYKLFRQFRPFIRIGSDYLVLQKAVDTSVSLKNQKDFDAYIGNHTQEEMDRFYKIFYQAREELLENEAEYWFSLNPLFSHMFEFLKKAAYNENVYILSTKKSWFIKKILDSHGIDFSINRIIDSGRDVKIEIIKDFMKVKNYNKALFIDDQLDHFKYLDTPTIEVYLPSWGYLNPSWREQCEYSVITPEESIGLLDCFVNNKREI